MKATYKVVALALAVCLIVTQLNSQMLTVMAKEPTQSGNQIQEAMLNNSDYAVKESQKIIQENQSANDDKKLISEQATTGSSINQNISSNSNSSLLDDPGIQKIIDEHFSEMTAGNSMQGGLTAENQFNEQNTDGNPSESDKFQEPDVTDRFIIKFKNNQAETRFQDKLVISPKTDQKNIQANDSVDQDFSKFKFGQLSGTNIGMKKVDVKDKNFSILKTEEKMKVEDLISKFSKNKLISDVEYIQPDYSMAISSEEPSEQPQGTPPAIDTGESQETQPDVAAETEEQEEPKEVILDLPEEQEDVTPPSIQLSTVTGKIITLNYDEELDEGSIPEADDFSAQVQTSSGAITEAAITDIAVNDENVLITLEQSVAADDGVALNYQPEESSEPIRDLAGNSADSFTSLEITNNTLAITQMINDPLYLQQWGLQAIRFNGTQSGMADEVGANISDAWEQSKGDGVVVAVIDTGIYTIHEDIQPCVWINADEIPDNGIDDDGNGYIDDINGWDFANQTSMVYDGVNAYDEWHGTHIAGIIAASQNNEKGISGIAPNAKIMVLKVFQSGTAYTSDIINAINYAKNMGAQIVNCSWGISTENTALREAMQQSGLLFVCAAGNGNRNIDINPVYPSSIDGDYIISVASLNKSGNLSRFSNYGSVSVDVAAPGEDILSTVPGDEYAESSGTSQATAFVTGEIALVLSKYPALGYDEIKDRLIQSSDQLNSVTEKVGNKGIINIKDSLEDPISPKDTVIEVEEDLTNGNPDNNLEDNRYSLFSSNDWNRRASIAAARRGAAVVSSNYKIYAVGGYNGTSYLGTIEEYNQVTNTWAAKTTMTTARSVASAGIVDGKVYVFGGYNGTSYLNTAEAFDIAANAWAAKTNMPTARGKLGVAVVNGKIYAIGGYNGTSYLNTVEEYNPVSNTWTAKASMTIARASFGIAEYNGKIYVMGGYNGSYLNSVEVYDPSTNTWSTKANQPASKAEFGLAVSNGKIYASGGTTGSGYLATLNEYDPKTDSWSSRANMITARTDLGMAQLNGKLYAVGGYNGSYLNTVEEYSPSVTSWTRRANSQTASRQSGTISAYGIVYVIGGYNGAYQNRTEAYEPKTNTWSTKANMPTARESFGIAAVNGKVFAIGGYSGTSYLNTVEMYDPIANTWSTKANMPTARKGLGAAVVNGKIYAIGGYNGASYLNTVEEYDPSTNSWVTKATMSAPRAYFGVSSVGGKVYAIGGYNGSTYLNTVEEYNPSLNNWSVKTGMTTSRAYLATTEVNGEIYAIAGNNADYLTVVEKYSPSKDSWTSMEKLPAARSYLGAASVTGTIFVIGGYDGTSYLNKTEAFTPVNPYWQKKNGISARRGLGVAVANGKIYAVGGFDLSQYTGKTEEYDPATDTWATKAAMPTPREGFGLAAVNGKLYAIGGYNGSQYLNTVEMYDPASNTWASKASFTTARGYFGTAAANGKIYIIGGRDATSYYGIVDEYDPVANTWASKANLNYARYNLSAAELNGKIYALDGRRTNLVYYLEEFDPAANTWTVKANTFNNYEHNVLVSAGGKLYAMGGYDGGGYVNDVNEYNPSTNSWSPKAGMMTARGLVGAAAVDGKIYAIGGFNGTYVLGFNEMFSPETGSWTTKANMSESRYLPGAAAIGDKIYVMGGNNSSYYLDSVEVYDTGKNTWTNKASMSVVKNGLACVSLNGKVYAIGGQNGGGYLNSLEEYDPESNTWTMKASMPTARADLGAAVVNGKIYAFGGKNSSYVSTLEVYDPGTNTWTAKASMSIPRAYFGVAVTDNKIYAIGGRDASYGYNYTEIYDTVKNTWTLKTSLPTARMYLGAASIDGNIYTFGGKLSNDYDSVEMYNPNINAYEIKTGMPTARYGLVTVEAGGIIYAIGGCKTTSTNTLTTVEAYDPAMTIWTNENDYFTARAFMGAVEMDGKIYAAGGKRADNLETSVLEAYDMAAGTWELKANMSMARTELGVAAVDGKLYAIGGCNTSGQAVGLVEEYDPASNTWTTKSSMPTPRYRLGVIAVNGHIFAIGGYTSQAGALNTVEEYDPINNIWTARANMPTERYFFGIAQINGEIYVAGGRQTGDLSVLEKYDPISNTWTTKAGMPTARYMLGGAGVNGKMYAVGGFNNNYLNIVEEYNPVSDQWNSRENMPGARAAFGISTGYDKLYLIGGIDEGHMFMSVETYNLNSGVWTTKMPALSYRQCFGAAEVNGKIYAVGGENGGSTLATNEEYDPSTNIWASKTSLPTVRQYLGVASVGGKVYAIGGYNGSSIVGTVDQYDPTANTWTTMAALSVARYGLGTVTVNGKIYAIGGFAGAAVSGVVEAYDPSTNTWTQKASMPTPRAYLGMTVCNGKIYAAGGYDGTYRLNEFEVYDPATDTWTSKKDMPTKRSNFGLASVNSKVYAVGGYNGLNLSTVEEYDPATDTWQTKENLNENVRNFAIAESKGLIYVIGGYKMGYFNGVQAGSYEKNSINQVAELVHLGEGEVNSSGNFSRTYTDLALDSPGFEIELSRTYNSGDDRTTSPFGKGWNFGFQGSIKDYETNQKMVRLPNGSAMTFTSTGSGLYIANDSRATLVKNADNTFTLTTKDQYKYGFDTNGWLNYMKDRSSNTISLTIDAATGNVTKITYLTNKEVTISYSGGLIRTITDPLGRVVTYGYNGSNQLITVTDPMGKVTHYSYDEKGYLSRITDNDNNLVEAASYDDFNASGKYKVATVTDVYNNITSYLYDTDYNKVTTMDSNGRETIKWFDSSLYPILVQEPDGRRTTTLYNLDSSGDNKYGEEQSVTDRNGNKTEYVRDTNGNVVRIYHPDSSYIEYVYDSKNNRISERDENGKYTFYIYDSNSINLVKKAQPLNGTDQYTTGGDEAGFAVTNYTYYSDSEAASLGYKAKGLLKSETDPVSNLTQYAYDVDGNRRTITDPEGAVTTCTYNAIGWKTGELSPSQYQTTYNYDSNENIEKVTLHGGEVTRTTYDNMGRKTKEVTPNLYNPALDNLAAHTYSGDHGTRYTYYPSGEIHTVTDACNNTTSYTYDLYGNVLTETLPSGGINIYTYDVLNRPSTVSCQENSSTAAILLKAYSYLILSNGNTQTTETVYLNGSETAVTTDTYDYAGRLIRTDNPDGTYNTTAYNANDTVASKTDERGNTTYFSYDGLNRLTGQWSPFKTSGGTLYSYAGKVYDKADRVLQDKSGKDAVSLNTVPTSNLVTVTYEYYRDDSLKSKTDSAGQKTEFWYDNEGNVSRQAITVDATTKNITDFANNYLNKPVTQTVHIQKKDICGFASDNTEDYAAVSSYTYDKNGNLATATRPVTTSGSITTTYTYDNLNRQTGVYQPGIDENGNTVTISAITTYNWNGDVLTETDANGHQTAYTFDNRGQLIRETDARNGVNAYYYDRAGRKTAEVSPKNYDPAKTLSQMNRTEYTYDKMDRLKTASYTYVDPVTSQWVTIVGSAFKYDANGNIIKELSALGFEAGTGSTAEEKINSGYGTEYTYDLADNNTAVLDAVSKDRSLAYTWQYNYDALGRKTAQTDARGYETSFTYDDAGNLLTTAVSGQAIQVNTYDKAGNLKTQADGNGNTTTYDYNALGKDRSVLLPGDATIQAGTVTYQYDLTGNLKLSSNTAGPVDFYSYDNQGKMLSHIQRKSDGTQAITVSAIRYDKAGNKRFVTDGNNVTTENVYDELDRLTLSRVDVTDANGNTTTQAITYGYDANGNQTSKTDWRGNTYTMVYDPLNKLIEKKDPYNVSIEKLEYDHNGSQIKSYDALNKLTQFTCDKNGRLLSTIDPLNHTVSQTYDNAGNINTKTDGRSKVTTYGYDQFNRLVLVVNAKNETTSYAYDLSGNMLTQTDGKGNVTTFEYNASNKPVRKIDHGGRTGTPGNYTYDPARTESYTYSADGNMASKVDRNNVTTSYSYDVHGRLLAMTAGAIGISYTYDGNGNQLTMTDGTGTTTRTYDQLNRTKTKAVPNIGTTTFLYDVTAGLGQGQTAETSTDPNGNVTTKVYDKAGRMISVTADGQTTGYTYYDNGSKHMVVYPDGSTEEYTYYDDNLLYTLVNKKADQTVIDSYTCTYDAAHNMASKVDGKGTTSYTYDDLERLLTVTEPSTQVTTYGYDAAGNRTSQTVALTGNSTVTDYAYNTQNRLTGSLSKLNNVTSQAISYAYDNNGNQLTETTTPYVNGIPQTPVTQTFAYDTLNQLITVTASGSAIITNTYNGEGKRVAKQAGTSIIRYLFEGNDVILEEDGSGNQLARNVWGTSLISRNVSGDVLYYMYNGHADVTALIDASGTIQATYYYDAFGNILESTGTANNPFKYAGYQYDDETGLYYLQSRYYDPVTARFITEDTYRGQPNDPLSLNLYTYCNNEPLMYSDPDGHSLKSIIKKATTAAKKAVSTAKTTVKSAASTVKKTATSITTNAKQTASAVKTAVTTQVKKTTTQVRQVATTTVSVGKGVTAGVKSTVVGIVQMAAHPVKTGKAIVAAASNPKQTIAAVKKEVVNTVKKDVIKGNAESRAKVITEAVLAVVGTKGLGTATKAAKAATITAKAEKAAAASTAIEATASKAGRLQKLVPAVTNTLASKRGAVTLGNAAEEIATKGTGNVIQKPVVIGENMERVQRYAEKIGADTYAGLPNYKELSKTLDSKKLNNMAIEHNRNWIQEQMNNGAQIIDAGPDFSRRLVRGYGQPAYEMERTMIKDYLDYYKAFIREGKYKGGVPGLDR